MQLLINGVLLIIRGLLAVYSVSIYESFSMTLKSVNFTDPTNYYFFYQQLKALVYIVVAMVLVWKFPLKIIKSHKFAIVALVGAFIFQCLVFTGLGDSYGTIAKGRINLPGLPSIQPSEIFKLAYVLFLSSRLLRKKEIMKSTQFLLNFIVINALLYAIFLFIPDFGTILILGITALIMVRYAGLSIKKTLAILAIGI
ncbi:MAG: FtsW/RodA/SpoVE family cell cycle protein [Candidatus Peribacteria bacterium]|nr:FtsW/RodA/SpoVE family cell cycle protein [Candidatus Peribacteria bacterium]